jgi:hypothetical protein
VSNATARRLFHLVEPIAAVTYLAPEPTEAVMALGAGTMLSRTSLDDFLMFRLRDVMVCFAKPLGEASTVG